MTATTPPEVVLSYGMGTDSTALLLRWILESGTRPCDLTDLLVVTAQTGDEWRMTGELVTRHMLPLMREHGIRWVQVARSGPRQADGVTVLDDTRQPATVYLEGAYKLSAEMTAAGTVPQAGGARKCSAKAKGWPLDQFIGRETGGQPYVHVVGFEYGEAGRAVRDATFNTETRTGSYPLIGWGWDRAACEDYIEARLGTRWLKSACVYCPFALLNAEGRKRVLSAYQADPQAGTAGLVMEHLAVSLNQRQGLIAGQRLARLVAVTPGQEQTAAMFAAQLDAMTWKVYEVRRAVRPRAGDPSKMASAVRSLRTVASGSRAAMAGELACIAARKGTRVTAEDGIGRAWLRRRGDYLPAAEWFYVAAPEGAEDKQGPGFAGAWPAALAGPAQGELALFGPGGDGR
jgi:hypothetical protein